MATQAPAQPDRSPAGKACQRLGLRVRIFEGLRAGVGNHIRGLSTTEGIFLIKGVSGSLVSEDPIKFRIRAGGYGFRSRGLGGEYIGDLLG